MYQDREWGDHRIHTLVTLAVGKETIICHILQVKYTVNDKAAHQIGYYSYLSPYSFVKAYRQWIQLFVRIYHNNCDLNETYSHHH